MSAASTIAADYIATHKAALLNSWRELVRDDPRLPEQRLALTNEQLEDHLPQLIDDLIAALRGGQVSLEAVRRCGAAHGSARRALGYRVGQVIWEFAIFRKLLREYIHNLAGELPAGELFAILDTVSNLTDESELGSVERYLEEARQERDTAREELSRANEQKDRFLAVLSHELRNPLASIRTAAHVLNGEHATPSGRRRALEIIDRQTRLIDDLLDMNRISQGRIELRREPIDLRYAIRNVIDTYLPAIESKSISFRFDCPGSEVMVLADLVRIEQVVSNLLTNSLKFTRRGGSIEIKLCRDNGEAIICVHDTGAGIEPSRLGSVFELFSGPQPGKGGEGLGIGLWLAKQLVEMHGGQIEVKSGGPEQGTQVVVKLQSIAAASRHNTVKHVLLVEDDPDQRELLTMALQEINADVVGAKDGSEAIAATRGREFDVCLLDLSLPDISGYDLIARLLEQQPQRPPVMVALTGYGRPEDAARVKAAGFQFHIVKPADIEELQRLIERA